MIRYFLILIAAFLASCASNGYHAKSVEEARAYARRAVETGVVHAGGEQELFAVKSQGKPATGKWNPKKIESFVNKWVENNPERARINLAATRGVITESQRLYYTSVLDMNEAAEAAAERQRKAAALQAVAAGLNASSAAMNEAAADRHLQAERLRASTAQMYSTPTYVAPAPILPQPTYHKVDLHPTYGGGYKGTITSY